MLLCTDGHRPINRIASHCTMHRVLLFALRSCSSLRQYNIFPISSASPSSQRGASYVAYWLQMMRSAPTYAFNWKSASDESRILTFVASTSALAVIREKDSEIAQ